MAGLADLLARQPQAQQVPATESPLAKLLSEATTRYQYLKHYNPAVTGKSYDGGFAETWPVGETGTAARPRPQALPMNRPGVEVRRPDQFGPNDLAAEFLHVDPVSHFIRQRMAATLTPEQIAMIQHEPDYQMSIAPGPDQTTPQKAMENGVDAALRGQIFGQWPADANARMRYTPQQQGLLATLQHYVTTGHQ